MRTEKDIQFMLAKCRQLHDDYVVGKLKEFIQYEINIGKTIALEWVLEEDKRDDIAIH